MCIYHGKPQALFLGVISCNLNPYFWSLKPSLFMDVGSKGRGVGSDIERWLHGFSSRRFLMESTITEPGKHAEFAQWQKRGELIKLPVNLLDSLPNPNWAPKFHKFFEQKKVKKQEVLDKKHLSSDQSTLLIWYIISGLFFYPVL